MRYWVTVAIEAHDQDSAEKMAHMLVIRNGAIKYTVDVQAQPPQGATIVGDIHEDEN